MKLFCCRWSRLGLGLVALVMVAASGCRALHPTERAERRVEVRAETELQRRTTAHAHFAAGVVHEISGNPTAAWEDFYQAAKANPYDSDLLLDVSGRLIEGRQFAKALEVLKLAVALPEVDAMIFVRLGFVYSQLGQERKALEANEIAVRRLPRFMPARQNLYLGLVQAGKPAAAWEVLADAATVAGMDAETLINLAELFSDYGRRFPERRDPARARAVELLELAQPAASGPLTLKLADGFYLLGQTEKAAALYLAFLERERISPALRDILRAKLADIYLRGDDRGRATEQLEALIRDNPENAGAHYFLGAIAAEEKRWADAVGCYQRVLLLQPDFEQAQLDLATAQLAGGQMDEAARQLGSLRRKIGPTFVIEYLLGMVCHEQDEYAEAVQHLVAAEKIALVQETNRLTTGFYFQLGATHERAGERVKAASYFEKSIALAPDNAEALNYLGYMWAERGEHLARARELIARALKLEPDNDAFLDSMGWVLFQQGDYAGALEYLLKAVAKSEKPDATIYDHLGDTYRALKEMDKAREAWAKSVSIEPNPKVQEKLDAPTVD